LLRKITPLERSLWLIAIGFFLFWAVDSWFARVISQYENHNANIHSEQNKKSEPFEKRPIVGIIGSGIVNGFHILESAHHEILSAFTIGLFFVTAALAWYTKDLAGRTKELANDAKSSGRKELRAYLSVTIANAIYQETGKGLLFEGRPELRNNGKTPAFKVTYSAVAKVMDWPLTIGQDFAVPAPIRQHNITVAPNQTFEMNAHQETFELDSTIPLVYTGISKRLMVWGRVDYEDVFGEKWHTYFCHGNFWRPGKDGSAITVGAYIEGLNEAT
jgi:hypothetical protein